MALAGALEKAGTPPSSVHTDAMCTVEKAGEGFKITRIKLSVRAQVPGVDEETFRKTAETTKDACPVSSALRGNVEIELDAHLEPASEPVAG
jgi:osmotically inducible protein OsmC